MATGEEGGSLDLHHLPRIWPRQLLVVSWGLGGHLAGGILIMLDFSLMAEMSMYPEERDRVR